MCKKRGDRIGQVVLEQDSVLATSLHLVDNVVLGLCFFHLVREVLLKVFHREIQSQLFSQLLNLAPHRPFRIREFSLHISVIGYECVSVCGIGTRIPHIK